MLVRGRHPIRALDDSRARLPVRLPRRPLAPVVVSRAPRKSGAKPKPEALTGAGGAPPLCAPGERLKGAVDVRSIVPTAPGAKPKPKAEEEALGPDFDDEGDVPPLL